MGTQATREKSGFSSGRRVIQQWFLSWRNSAGNPADLFGKGRSSGSLVGLRMRRERPRVSVPE